MVGAVAPSLPVIRFCTESELSALFHCRAVKISFILKIIFTFLPLLMKLCDIFENYFHFL